MQISITEIVSVCQNNKEETNCTDIYKKYCDYINNLACFTSFWARVFLQCSSMQNVHFWKEPCLHKNSVEIHLIAFSHQHHHPIPTPTPKHTHTHIHIWYHPRTVNISFTLQHKPEITHLWPLLQPEFNKWYLCINKDVCHTKHRTWWKHDSELNYFSQGFNISVSLLMYS